MLLVAFLLVNAPNCHLLLVLASVVQGDAVNCNIYAVCESQSDVIFKFATNVLAKFVDTTCVFRDAGAGGEQ